jgi:hypothetical protein
MGAVPITSSLTPTKNNNIKEAIKNLKLTTVPSIKSYSTGNHNAYEKTIAPNITTPPRVGILHLCIFLSSVGESTKFFNLATLIKEGIENRTTKKAVKKPNINMYVPVKIYCY